MYFKSRLILTLSIALVFMAGKAWAQADDEDEDDFGSFGFLADSPKSVTVSMKLTQGPKVDFSNIGTIIRPVPFASVSGNTTVTRVYDDGLVNVDQPRRFASGNNQELDLFTQNPVPAGGRYSTYLNNDPTLGKLADYLAYYPGRTRNWQYYNKSQGEGTPGYIAFHHYSALSDGESLKGSQGYNGGFELNFTHALTNPTKRFSLSLSAGLTLSGIYSSKIGTVHSKLLTYTDLYRFYPDSGTDAPIGLSPIKGNWYSAPSEIMNVDGVLYENTTTLDQNPDTSLHQDEETADGAEVEGTWKIKGAYFTFKLGPQFNAMLTHSLSLSAGIGVTGTYASTHYSAIESFTPENALDPLENPNEGSDKTIMLPGYYASIDANWAINERTGIFAGFSYENLGTYNQRLEDRLAKIDLSASAGVRGGFSIKF